MKRILLLAVTSLIPVAIAAPTLATTTTDLVVRFEEGTDPDAAAAALEAQGFQVDEVYHNLFPGAVISAAPGEVTHVSENDFVDTVDFDTGVRLAGGVAGSWGIDRIDQRNLPLSGTYGPAQTGAGVRIYVVDTGIRADHDELAGRVGPGFDAIGDGNGTGDCHGHGTHVAGIAAGRTLGVAPAATVIPVRVLNCVGWGTSSEVIAGLDFIVGDKTDGELVVANLSLIGGLNETLDAAIEAATDAGVLVIAAAGNAGKDACNYSPARVAAAVTVGASTDTDAKPSWSNHGPCLDLFAPGQSIRSAYISSPTATVVMSGTSMAAPHAAGAAALLLSAPDAPTSVESAARRLAAEATELTLSGAGTDSPGRLLYSGAEPAAPEPEPAAVAVTTTELAAGERGQVYDQVLSAGGGRGAYTWNVSAGALPTGLVLDRDGNLRGSPQESGVFEFTVAASDPDGRRGTAPLALEVLEPLTVTAAGPASGHQGIPYSQILTASGGAGSYQWSIDDGGLPTGVTLTGDGRLSGIPGDVGVFGFTVSVKDRSGRNARVPLTLVIAHALAVSTTVLPDAAPRGAYRTALLAEGIAGPYRWRLAGGSLPAGLTLSPDGTISGSTRNAVGSTFVVTVTDTAGRNASRQLNLRVVKPLSISTSALGPAGAGVVINQTLVANGGVGPYQWLGANLPSGLTVTADGRLEGVAGEAGMWTVTLTVTDARGASVQRSIGLTVSPPAPPGTFTKSRPANGSRRVPAQGSVLAWSAARGAVSYEVCLTRTVGQCPVWVPVGASLSLETGSFPAGTRVFWQVRAVNPHGVRDSGAWWSFTTR